MAANITPEAIAKAHTRFPNLETQVAMGLDFSPEDSHVNPTALQENVRRLVTSVTCGMNAPGLQTNLSLDGASLKTCRDYLLANADRFSPEFSMTWPRWGIASGGEFGALSMSAHRTEGTESSLWPTPDVRGFTNNGSLSMLSSKVENRDQFAAMAYRAGAAKKEKMWPTPTSHLAKETNAPSEKNRNEPTISSIVGGALNPEFVEWLMGFPIGHTDLER
jgi:hypothetical protein